jgi:hypothetical protein
MNVVRPNIPNWHLKDDPEFVSDINSFIEQEVRARIKQILNLKSPQNQQILISCHGTVVNN